MKFPAYRIPPLYALFPLIILFISLAGCNRSLGVKIAPGQITLVQLLVGNGTNLFRNVSINMVTKTVLASEKKIPDERDTNYLFYSLPMDTLYPDSVNEPEDTMNYFTIAYTFDMDKLVEIDEDVFLSGDSAASSLQQRLSDYFDDKYGEGIKESDQTIWKIKKINSKYVKLSLSDKSEEYDYGKLSLVYYLED